MKADAAQSLAEAALSAVEAQFATDDVELPERRYWTYGTPPVDCEMVVCAVERVYAVEGDPTIETAISAGGHLRAGFAMRAATLAVWVIRCVPTSDDRGRPPSVTALEENAALVTADMARVLNGLVAAVKAGDLPGCSSISLDEWEPNRAGGFGGGITRVRAVLGG